MYKACETCGVSYDPDYGHNCRGPTCSTLYLMERDQWMQRALAAESKLEEHVKTAGHYASMWREAGMERDELQRKLTESQSRLHQLSEDHSHCEGLLHELGERASRAEGGLEECLDLIADAVANHESGGRCDMDLARASVVLARNEPVVEKPGRIVPRAPLEFVDPTESE